MAEAPPVEHAISRLRPDLAGRVIIPGDAAYDTARTVMYGGVDRRPDEGEARVHAAYPGSTWDRLTVIKARYDPTKLFHLNQNIPPAGGGR